MKIARLFVLLAAICGGPLAHSFVRADTISLSPSSDTYIRDGRSYTVSGVDPVLDARTLSTGAFVPYMQFDLSALNIDAISNATLRVWRVPGSRPDGINADRFATYGLNDDPNNTRQFWHETNDFDPNEEFNGLDFRNVGNEWNNSSATNGIDRALLTSLDPEDGGVAVTETITGIDATTFAVVVTGADLVAFLNNRVDANGLATFLFPIESTPDRGYGIASKENADTTIRPVLELEYTVVPEPASSALFFAGAMTSMLIRRREE